MEKRIKELIAKVNFGTTTKEEERELEKYIEQGAIDPNEIDALQETYSLYVKMDMPEPSNEMLYSFRKNLSASSGSAGFDFTGWFDTLWQQSFAFKLAYSMILLAVGLSAGYLINASDPRPDDKIENLTAEITEMKEMMMLTLLEKESTSDRLKAVNLTSEMPQASEKVINALLKTLNNDPNVNVRLAAIEALTPYSGIPEVRRGLIEAIGHQDSPMVQMALAELMVALMEKRSVDELKQIIQKEGTPPEVKEKIRQSITTLI